MFTCFLFRKKLVSYVEGELSPEDKRKFTAHLKRCERCREELSGIKEVISLFREAPLPPRFLYSEAEFISSIRERAEREERKYRLSQLPRFAVAASLLAVVLFIGFLWLGSHISQSEVEQMESVAAISDIPGYLDDILPFVDEDTFLAEINDDLAEGEAELYQYYLEKVALVSGPSGLAMIAGFSQSDYETLLSENAHELTNNLFPSMEEGR